jgi:basic membrane lipoprotein Med (substrate-binding protein (PBP1-ABC) superfamily)
MNKEEGGTDVVVTSALWHMENAIDHAIGLVKGGNWSAEEYHSWTMMAKGGASLAPFYEFESKISADVKAKIADLSAQIIAGDFVVIIDDSEPKSTY